jgi:hypothetical protein
VFPYGYRRGAEGDIVVLTRDLVYGADRAIVGILLDNYPNNLLLTSDQILPHLSTEYRTTIGDNAEARRTHVRTVRRHLLATIDELRRLQLLDH